MTRVSLTAISIICQESIVVMRCFSFLEFWPSAEIGTLSSLFIAGKYPQDIVALLKTLRLEFNPTMGQKACLSELALSNFSEYSEA